MHLNYVSIFVLNVVCGRIRFKTSKFMHTCPYFFRIFDIRVYGIIKKILNIKDFNLFLQIL